MTRGFNMRVDDVAGDICQTLPRHVPFERGVHEQHIALRGERVLKLLHVHLVVLAWSRAPQVTLDVQHECVTAPATRVDDENLGLAPQRLALGAHDVAAPVEIESKT